MENTVILHSTSLNELKTVIGDVLREELRNFKPEIQVPNRPQGEYLTRKEVCILLKISPATLHYWTKDGILQGYRIRGRVLYKSVEVGNTLSEMPNLKNVRKGGVR